MKFSDEGKRVLAEREALKLTSYLDKVATPAVWTIGLGHTTAAGPPSVHKGMTITEAEAWEIFDRDCEHFRRELDGVVKVPLEQHQHDALCSFIYNVGGSGFKRSTLLKRLNAGDFDGAGEAILMWNKPPAIMNRRRGEYHQFKSARYVARIDAKGNAA